MFFRAKNLFSCFSLSWSKSSKTTAADNASYFLTITSPSLGSTVAPVLDQTAFWLEESG
jgi:hypothetical protein